ncbi:MAG TPA: prepilin-type N-terminal cleavage/methylation domain-containing protein [Thermoanaerobaculia bacterium]
MRTSAFAGLAGHGPADGTRTSLPSARRRMSGFTLLEIIVVLGILGIMILVAAPLIFRIYKRERLRSTVQEVYAQVLAARMQAVRRNTPVVVFFDLPNRDIISWADLPPNDYIQNVATEPTINKWHIPEFVVFSFAPGGVTDDFKSVSFDTYAGNALLKDRVIFQGDGTLLAPQSANSVQPAKPATYTTTVPVGSINCTGNQCRGIYISDRDSSFDPQRNVFRISVDDFGSTGKASLTKYLPLSLGGNAGETDYVPGSPWIWNE